MDDLTGRKVVVTTEFRGVFFGTLAARDPDRKTATLTGCRNCLYWPISNKGFLGLACAGPQEGSRVGPAAELTELYGVTSVTLCTPEAAVRWESGVWS